MMIIICAISAVMTIMFLMGKGSFLIAGYNTSSKKEKQHYDEKKLCRLMGIGMGLITLGLLASSIEEKIGMYATLGMSGVGILIILFGSKYCYSEEYVKELKTDNKPWYKKSWVWSGVIGVGTVVFVCFIMFIGEVNVAYHDDYMTISASMTGSKDVYYHDIENIEYQKDIHLGKKRLGVGNGVIKAGSYKNDLYDSYKLYSYNSCKEYIVLDTKVGIVVVNDKTSSKTQELYQEIQKRIQKNQE